MSAEEKEARQSPKEPACEPFRSLKEVFALPDIDIRTYSPLTLAFLGDGVFDLVIRTVVVGEGNDRPDHLNRRTSGIVRARSQARMIEALLPSLTEEELEIYRRGRNAKSPTMAKHATMSDYRKATGLEALVGYLYLTNRFARAAELIRTGLSAVQPPDAKRGSNM